MFHVAPLNSIFMIYLSQVSMLYFVKTLAFKELSTPLCRHQALLNMLLSHRIDQLSNLNLG